ncbi:MAG: Secretion system C-terminal sorting domain [Bacteroidota bacterium]|jgi:hypothetical protein
MKNQLAVTPALVPANSSILIQRIEKKFPCNQYQVTNENGDVIRKGFIQDISRDFSISVRGMPDGIYFFIVGDNKERFTIV